MSDERKPLQAVPEMRDVTATIRETFADRNLREGDWLPYEEWEQILRRAMARDSKTGRYGFSGVLGVALAARAEWLKESRRLGLPPAEAERRFCERIDRERAEQKRVENETARSRAQIAEQSRGGGRKRGGEAEI